MTSLPSALRAAHDRLVGYKVPCSWCPKCRQGKPANLVRVAVPLSSGMCPECLAIERAHLPTPRPHALDCACDGCNDKEA